MEASIFKLVSIGRASENKKRGVNKLNVLPVEFATASDGEINFDPSVMSESFKDINGAQAEVSGIVARELECAWLPSEDNRITSPDIRRDELIEVWRMGDTDQYYWRSMGLSNNLRALESVIYAWGASPDLGGYGLDLTKCYTLSVSAHDKHFTIHTTKANGELYEYTIQINSGESAVYITDDANNFIELDSREKRIQLKNSDNSYVKVEKKFIELSADQYIDLKVMGCNYRMTPDTISAMAPKTINLTAGTNMLMTIPQIKTLTDRWQVI